MIFENMCNTLHARGYLHIFHYYGQLWSRYVTIGEKFWNRIAHRIVHVQLLLDLFDAEFATTQKCAQTLIIYDISGMIVAFDANIL